MLLLRIRLLSFVAFFCDFLIFWSFCYISTSDISVCSGFFVCCYFWGHGAFNFDSSRTFIAAFSFFWKYFELHYRIIVRVIVLLLYGCAINSLSLLELFFLTFRTNESKSLGMMIKTMTLTDKLPFKIQKLSKPWKKYHHNLFVVNDIC